MSTSLYQTKMCVCPNISIQRVLLNIQHLRVSSVSDTAAPSTQWAKPGTKYKLDPILHMSHSHMTHVTLSHDARPAPHMTLRFSL